MKIDHSTSEPTESKKETAGLQSSAVKKNLALQNMRILVADDSLDNRLLVGLILKKQGAVVETAQNGIEAVRMGLNGSYDVIIMDIQMPEMDGHEATRTLRDAGFNKPIIALTANAMPEDRAKTLASGCNEHLTKPINHDELIESIERYTKQFH